MATSDDRYRLHVQRQNAYEYQLLESNRKKILPLCPAGGLLRGIWFATGGSRMQDRNSLLG